MKRVNVLIINCYTWRNKGDGAIAETAIRLIQQEAPHAKVTVATYDVDSDKDYYSRFGVRVVAQVLSQWKQANRLMSLLNLFLQVIDFLLSWVTRGRLHLLGTYRQTWRAYREADLILSVGGGYITSSPARFGTLWLAIHLAAIAVGVRFQKPTVMQSQSIGPFLRQMDARLTSYVLKQVERLTVRDHLSYQRVKEMGVPLDRLHVSPDYAFLQYRASLEEILPYMGFEMRGPAVGISVRRWMAPLNPGAPYDMHRYLNEVAKFASELSRRGVSVFLIPQVTQAGDDDSVETQVVHELCDHTTNVKFIDTREFSPGQIKALYGTLDILVGTRMHANIMALGCGVPVIAIAYHMKTVGIMQAIGLGEWCTAIEKATSERLLELYNSAISKRENLSATVQEKLSILQCQILNNVRDDLAAAGIQISPEMEIAD
jgi:colanic acid/amylovoran biosynthesis protein